MLKDLHMSTADYSKSQCFLEWGRPSDSIPLADLGQTIFYVSFLFMELPSQLISKKLGVDRWVPFQMVLCTVADLEHPH